MAIFQNFQALRQKRKKGSPPPTDSEWLKELFECNLVPYILEDYIQSCREIPDDDPASLTKVKKRRIFPNLAGFCRYLKVGISTFCDVAGCHPYEYDRILAVLEDEALNSELSATLLSSYMKKRLCYEKADDRENESGGLKICFEHDIYKDGE